MAQLGPNPTPDLDAAIGKLKSLASQLLLINHSGSKGQTRGWMSVRLVDGLVISGLPPDDVDVRIDGRLVFGEVRGGWSLGTHVDINRAIEILESYFVLELLAKV